MEEQAAKCKNTNRDCIMRNGILCKKYSPNPVCQCCLQTLFFMLLLLLLLPLLLLLLLLLLFATVDLLFCLLMLFFFNNTNYFLLLVYVQNTQQVIVPGIQQVLPPRKCKDYILNCHKKKRMPIGKRIDFLRMQSITPKLRRNVLNARRLMVTVS